MESTITISDEALEDARRILDSAIEFGVIDDHNGQKFWLDSPIIGLFVQANGSEFPVYIPEHATHFSVNIMKLDRCFIGEQARLTQIAVGGVVINGDGDLYKAIALYNKEHAFDNPRGWSRDQIIVIGYDNHGNFEAVYPA